MFNTLVLGGTGFLGRDVCEKLVERSGGAEGPITVPTRRPMRRDPTRPPLMSRGIARATPPPTQRPAKRRGPMP